MPGNRAERRKQRIATAILEAAQRLFAARSVDVTIEQIADAADVAVGSIYNHFGSKDGLLLAVDERALAADERYIDAAYDPSRPPIEQIAAAGEWYFRLYLDHPELFRLVAFPPRPHDGPATEIAVRVAARVDARKERLVTTIRGGIEAGMLRPVPAEEAATFLWAAWNGLIALGWRPDQLRRSPDELAELLRVATDVVTRGLLAGPTRHP